MILIKDYQGFLGGQYISGKTGDTVEASEKCEKVAIEIGIVEAPKKAAPKKAAPKKSTRK